MKKPKVAVILAGCGYLDGTDVHEATLTLLSLDKAGAQAVCFAPDAPQADVQDHGSQQPVPGEARDTFAESARIARCDISRLSRLNANDVDALMIPGGYGAAKNLCSFVTDGVACKVNPDLQRLMRQMVDLKKPMAFLCISPVIAAKVLGEQQPELTIGNDPDTAAALTKLGAKHVTCPVDEAVVDRRLKLVSSPAYMLGPSIASVGAGIDKAVRELLSLVTVSASGA